MLLRLSIVFCLTATLIHSSPNENSICPDPSWHCPGATTCCLDPSGNWGCCPFPAATCCSDGIHCCPFQTTCSGSMCVYSSNKSFAALEKVPALKSNATENNA
ncbi:hypothetical protein PENTCL1PPCAC_27414 [Pristionchus entomophagus]|uniref:Granulins domain-containing protein n=1 Tax=Pristionchus entomophagus TaxID=358040 RepID=A0AAV5UE69_9BILA|nr:hypothetical protein PENTCL1PPCAC_27414 [Pristionchus entomophagus]